jgi:hypothetical protein
MFIYPALTGSKPPTDGSFTLNKNIKATISTISYRMVAFYCFLVYEFNRNKGVE